jgi:hypothetical protein
MHNTKASILFVVFVVIALIALSHTVALGSVVMVGSRETCELSGCSADDLSVSYSQGLLTETCEL